MVYCLQFDLFLTAHSITLLHNHALIQAATRKLKSKTSHSASRVPQPWLSALSVCVCAEIQRTVLLKHSFSLHYFICSWWIHFMCGVQEVHPWLMADVQQYQASTCCWRVFQSGSVLSAAVISLQPLAPHFWSLGANSCCCCQQWSPCCQDGVWTLSGRMGPPAWPCLTRPCTALMDWVSYAPRITQTSDFLHKWITKCVKMRYLQGSNALYYFDLLGCCDVSLFFLWKSKSLKIQTCALSVSMEMQRWLWSGEWRKYLFWLVIHLHDSVHLFVKTQLNPILGNCCCTNLFCYYLNLRSNGKQAGVPTVCGR